VSDELRLQVTIDDTDIVATSADIEDVDAQVDAVVDKWAMSRQEIINGIRISINAISSLMSSFREALNLIGLSIDPFFSSLFSMVMSTISMMLGVAAGYAATGIGAGIATVVASVALYMQVVLLGKLVADKIAVQATMSDLQASVSHLMSGRTPIGGSF
jgi:hypothetical protein